MIPLLVRIITGAAAFGFAFAAFAQDSPGNKPSPEVELAPGNVAFFRIVNAIGLTTPTKVSFRTAAEPKWSTMEPGEASGMRVLRLGSYHLCVANEGCDKPEVEDIIPLTTGGGYTLIILYTEPVEKDGKITHRIQYSKLERNGKPQGPRLSVVSLLPGEPLPVQINDQSVSLPPRRAQHFDRKLNDSVTIACGGAAVMDPVEITEEIPYLVFLYKNEVTGKVEGSLAREISVVLELPRSIKNKNSEEAEKPKAEPQP
jgi:hypothetical protein